MSAQDPISDMLTRIRNALAVNKRTVSMPWSRHKHALVDLLVAEGYLISGEKVPVEDTKHFSLVVSLKYYKNKPVIEKISRASRPSLRLYSGKDELPLVDSGLGIAVISTSKGLMSNHRAKSLGLGGEVLFYVS